MFKKDSYRQAELYFLALLFLVHSLDMVHSFLCFMHALGELQNFRSSERHLYHNMGRNSLLFAPVAWFILVVHRFLPRTSFVISLTTMLIFQPPLRKEVGRFEFGTFGACVVKNSHI
jgi:hypothetical protein